ncbi:MerR family transcriptional regulator [Streptomyces sp. NPDC056161]|uniref:MerR family transcriptional regulator n=1 Tax=Streptomyces sp. NPDC056161 TaxID=3345732 RepID=UPI0035D7C299
MKIGELAAQAGVSVRALRYYEEGGLLRSERTPAGQRTYPDGALERVLFIQQLFAAGLASRTIITILPCIDTGKLSTDQLALLTSERLSWRPLRHDDQRLVGLRRGLLVDTPS